MSVKPAIIGGPTLLIAALGCVTVDLNAGGSANPDTIRVIFQNLTLRALDVEFYSTDVDVTDPDTQLFIADNKLAGIGFAATGLLEPLDSDSVDLACDQVRVLGTNGGLFMDADDGSELGRGTRRILVLDQLIQCGETLRLRYSESAGSFETTFSVE